MAAIDTGPHADAAQAHVSGLRLVAQVAHDHVPVVLGVQGQVLQAERVGPPHQRFGRRRQVDPAQGHELAPLAAQFREPGNRQPVGQSISPPRKIDDATAVGPGLLQGREDRGRVIFHAVSFGPEVPDVELPAGPRSRSGHAQPQRFAPRRRPAASVVDRDLVLAGRQVGGQRGAAGVGIGHRLDLPVLLAPQLQFRGQTGARVAQVLAEPADPASGRGARPAVSLHPPCLRPVQQAGDRPAGGRDAVAEYAVRQLRRQHELDALRRPLHNLDRDRFGCRRLSRR